MLLAGRGGEAKQRERIGGLDWEGEGEGGEKVMIYEPLSPALCFGIYIL